MALTPHPRPAQSRSTRVGLWYGLLGGGVAWTVHLLGSYFAAEFGCASGLDRYVYLGVMLPAWILIGVALVAALLAALATLVAWRLGRRFGAWAGDAREDDPDAYMARAGFLTSALFTAVIVVESLPILYFLGGC